MKFPVNRNNWIIIFLFLGSFLWAQTEFKIPDPPSKIYPVNDYAGVLSSEQKDLLNQKLISYSDSTSTQILVCIVNTLDGDDINYVGAKWGNEWKLGQKGTNNGIILLISVQERRLAIQNGRGTEDSMTDMASGIIINQYMVPYLKHNDFYGAVNSGTDQIIALLQGKFKPDKSKGNTTDDDFSGLGTAIFIFIIILFFVFISSGGNNGGGTSYDKRGRRRDGGDFWGGGGFFGGGLGSGGFGGRGSSGGGFGGFGGGGSFGGGGASGSW